jgi:hypothetical protein
MAKRDRSGSRLIRLPAVLADVLDNIKAQERPRRLTTPDVLEKLVSTAEWVNPKCLEPLRKPRRRWTRD